MLVRFLWGMYVQG